MKTLILAILTLVAGTLARFAPPRSPRRRAWTALALVSLVIAAIGLMIPAVQEDAVVDLNANAAADAGIAAEAQALIAAPLAPSANPEYVGAESCRACHADQFRTWHDSYHRSMTQRATPETVVAPFENVVLQSRGREFRLAQSGDQFWVELPDPELEMSLGVRALQTGMSQAEVAAAVNQHRVRRPIVMTTGSHQHQTYWLPGPNGMLFQLPWVYHIQHSRWVPRYDSFLSPHRDEAFFNVWNVTCVMCHSTAGAPKPNAATRRLETEGEMGIACEACHGPGRTHVEAHADPPVTWGSLAERAPDPTIVNPARLAHVRASHVCGQCHAYFHRTAEQYQHWLAHGSTYRPGDDLEDHRLLLRFDPDAEREWIRDYLAENPDAFTHQYWPDGTVRTGGRELSGLVESACYQVGEMSCLSCHSMHNSDPIDQLAAGREGNEACTQCHGESQYTSEISDHTHHAAGSSGSLCYNCHMPHTTYVLMGAVRSHRIAIPEVVSGVRGARPNACNLCHLDQSLAWTSRQLNVWHGTPEVEVTDEEREIAASLLWLIKGDATQRLMAAWSMGWPPAQEASGTEWMPPFLAMLLPDPYSAIRDIAHRSLKTLPGYEDVRFDFLSDESHFESVTDAVRERWKNREPTSAESRLMMTPDRALDTARIDMLWQERDNRPIEISE